LSEVSRIKTLPHDLRWSFKGGDDGGHRPDAQALGPARHLRVMHVQHAARRQVRHAFLRRFPHSRFPFPSFAAWGMPVTSPPGP
jgi:hypothetical protein